jgi:hypothetical protein
MDRIQAGCRAAVINWLACAAMILEDAMAA